MILLHFRLMFFWALSVSVSAREWTNHSGKVIEAEFLRMGEKEFRVEISKFREDDQQFAREQSSEGDESA